MDAAIAGILGLGLALASLFNYYLNRAPGSDPDDFAIGPPNLGVRCDCIFNVLVMGGIVVVALAASSSIFSTRVELYAVALSAFMIITVAGYYGRRQRHKEWEEMAKVFKRALPDSAFSYSSDRQQAGLSFDDYPYDDDEDDEEDPDYWFDE
ncbi:hypothetical protein EU546_06465 [Candidatus Thorarchaeota archaeon]|nr:MAG: hypothetical protein EU546_06465 [Candidatus Thorarchaeota archaeon]